MKCSAVFLLGSILIAQDIINSQAAPTETATDADGPDVVHNYRKRHICSNVGKFFLWKFDIEQYRPIPRYYRSATRNSARKRMTGILGCKFPFHYGVFVCCRSNRGDCSKHHQAQMKRSATTFKKCMEAGTYGQRLDNFVRCWVDAEKTHACSKSFYDASYWMKKVNYGVTW